MISPVYAEGVPLHTESSDYTEAEQELNKIEADFQRHVSASIWNRNLHNAFTLFQDMKRNCLDALSHLQKNVGYHEFHDEANRMKKMLKAFVEDSVAIHLKFNKAQSECSSLLSSSIQKIAETAKSVLPEITIPEPKTAKIIGTGLGAACGGATSVLVEIALREATALRSSEEAHHARDILKTKQDRLASAIKYEQKVANILEKAPSSKAAVKARWADKVVNARTGETISAYRHLDELKQLATVARNMTKHPASKTGIAIGVVVGAVGGVVVANHFTGEEK